MILVTSFFFFSISWWRCVPFSCHLARYLLGGWNLQSVVAYVLVLALIPVFRPWRERVEWEYGVVDFDYTTAGIVSPVVS